MYRATEVLKYRQNYRFGASMTATIAAISLPCHPVDRLDSKFESGLLVGDVLLPDKCSDAQFAEWLSTLQKIARRAGLRKIIFQTCPGSRLHEKLSARFPAHPSWAVCCLTSDAAMQPFLEKMRFGYSDFDTF